jgi:hypothetical protein
MEEATSTSESLDVQLGTSVRYNLALRLKSSTKDRPNEQQQQQHVPALRPKATATSKRAVVRAAARAALRLFGCFRNAAIEDSFVDPSALSFSLPPPPPPPPAAAATTTAAPVNALLLPAPGTSWQSPVVVANVDALSAVFSEFASHDERPVITEQGIHDLLVRFGVDALCSKRELAALLRRQHPEGCGGVPFEGFIQALRSLATTSLQHLPADDDEDDVRLAFLLHLMEPSLFDVGELNHTLKPHIDRRRIDVVAEKRPSSHIKADDKFLLECQTGIGMTTDDTVSSP